MVLAQNLVSSDPIGMRVASHLKDKFFDRSKTERTVPSCSFVNQCKHGKVGERDTALSFCCVIYLHPLASS